MDQKFDEDSFLFAANSDFVEELYLKYLENPTNVDNYWQKFFAKLDENKALAKQATVGASWLPRKNKVILPPEVLVASMAQKPKTVSAVSKSFNAHLLIEGYRAYGHFSAILDPLGIEKTAVNRKLDLKNYGLTEADLDTEISLDNSSLNLEKCTIRQLIDRLKEIYCSSAGYELSHLSSDEERAWFYQYIEQMSLEHTLSKEEKITTLKDLIDVEAFEQFIHVRFPGTKRFSVEGGETSIIAVNEIIKTATLDNKVNDVTIGLAHRGRLNMLTKIMGKSYAAMLSEFQGNLAHLEELNISGDVKYHLGKSVDYVVGDNHRVHLSLTANPSHLEAVDPVVVGKVRAKQDDLNDQSRTKAMGILMHGDAAFSGQGVVAETLMLSNLEGYTTGGTMHIVVNNQIGFTTLPKDSRSGPYCTEFAKIIGAPVIHLNGDDVEKVLMVSRMAEFYRHKFKKDIVLDIICFRKYGHNEGDEPMFTQPIMYNAIKNKKSSAEIYAEYLNDTGVMSREQTAAYRQEKIQFFDKNLEEAKTYKPFEEDWLKGKWSGLDKADRVKEKAPTTGIGLDKIKQIGQALIRYPKDMEVNSKILRLFEQKNKMLQTGEGIDWAFAEALAYGSLLLEGSRVRMSGQDCKRSTFSHRHAVLFDQISEKEYVSLNHINETQAKFEVINSNLSEYAVLGFEYGYSLIDPNNLTIWEAQFGDFANGAQIIIDQFISSAEVKWLRKSGLVMLLPHGYEGQGPEHSSARLERFLQLCAEGNMQVVNCTTPANFFHVIRRQIHRKFRKPLIVMSPKSLLRHRLMVSNISEFLEGEEFKPVIGDIIPAKEVKRVVICSGKVYFDLYEAREKNAIKSVALVRIDQYYPFPKEQLAIELNKYQGVEIVWCQEEPKNMGAWYYINDKIEDCLSSIEHKTCRAKYIGRPESASPSAGYFKMHNAEQEKFVREAITIE